VSERAQAAEAGVIGAIGIWPVRVEGLPLADRLRQELGGELFRPWERLGPQKEFFQKCFEQHSYWILIMATGIAVRFTDGLLEDKHQDPAVVVVDEAARHAIALVGGHEAGANVLAYRVADAVGAIPVITTATEALKPLVVGIGCRKGVGSEQLEKAVVHALRQYDSRVALDSVREFVTVDLKANEPGLVSLSQRYGIPLRVIRRHQIESRPWVTKASEWVRLSVGLDGVCEPCALIACTRGRLVVPKTVLDGVAVAVVEDSWSVDS
jgi:cobalt-precorrin 5A hydrolase